MTRTNIFAFLALASAGLVAGSLLNGRRRHAALAEDAPQGRNPVRNAGPEDMRDPPRRWSQTDEEVDESFPASDPPANY